MIAATIPSSGAEPRGSDRRDGPAPARWWPGRAVPFLGGLMVLCLPLGRFGQFRVAGFPLSLAKLVAIGLMAAVVADRAGRPRPSVASTRRWFADLDTGARSAAVGMACLTASLFLRPDVALENPVQWLQLASNLVLAVLVAVSWPGLDGRRRFAVAIGLAALTMLLVLLTAGDTEVFNYFGAKTTRFGGTLSNANDWAGAVLAVGAVLWAQAARPVTGWSRALVWLLGAGLMVALLLTQSRGGAVALIGAGAGYALIAGGRRARFALLAVSIVALTAFFGLRAADGGPFSDSITVRRVLALSGDTESQVVDGESVQVRIDLVNEAGSTFVERPVVGHGAGAFAAAVDYRDLDGRQISGHNIVAVAAVEHGVLGLVGTALLVAPGLFWMARGEATVSRRMAAGLLGVWLMGMSIDLLDDSYFWMVLGLAWAEAAHPALSLPAPGRDPRSPRDG